MFHKVYITIDPFTKTTEFYPVDTSDAAMCSLKRWFDEVADAFENRFRVKVENDVLNERVIATLVGTEETCAVGYSEVGFATRQIFDAVRFLAEEVGLFQWDEIVCAGEVVYRREK